MVRRGRRESPGAPAPRVDTAPPADAEPTRAAAPDAAPADAAPVPPVADPAADAAAVDTATADAKKLAARTLIEKRDPRAFNVEYVTKPDGDLDIQLTIPPRHEFIQSPPSGDVGPVEAPLSAYVDGLKGVHMRHDPEGGTAVRFAEEMGEDGKPILYLPKIENLDARRALVPAILLAVAERGVLDATKTVKEKGEALHHVDHKLHSEHSPAKRVKMYRDVEEAWVKAHQERSRKIELILKKTLDKVKEEQNLDIAAPLGGTKQWLKDVAKPTHDAVRREWWNGTVVFGDHKYEDQQALRVLPSEATMRDRAGAGLDNMGIRFANARIRARKWGVEKAVAPMLVDQKMIAGEYEALEEEIQKMPEGFMKMLRLSAPFKARRDLTKIMRQGWQGPKFLALHPMASVGAVGIGFGILSWGITDLPLFKQAKDQLKTVGKDILHFFGIEVGKGGEKKADH